MARRLFVLTTVLLLLAVFTVAQAQEPVTRQPSTALTGLRSTSYSLSLGGTSPYLGTTPANANGFIMSDGRICNPRWGC